MICVIKKYTAASLTATHLKNVNVLFCEKFSLAILFNTAQAEDRLLSPALHCLTCKGIQEIPGAKQNCS